MVIKVSGESPFQILSTSFSIGPSADGYDLMFSADGINYSKLFTVGANTNRQVTQVAAGSYYYLAGNTGNVVVNWFGNCVVDNGGGGGGTPADYNEVKEQVSANTENIETLSGVTSGLTEAVAGKQDTLSAGNGIDLSGSTISVKIGDGLAFSGDTLVVSGGSGEQNYVIVNSLSEITNPYAGLEAYRREYTESVVYTGYTIDASQISEGYVAHIYYDGQNEIPVYRSEPDFYWVWNNELYGGLKSYEDFLYTINGEHTIFTVLFNNPDAYVTFEEGVTTAATSTTITTFHKALTYRYNGTSWEEYQLPKVYYLSDMTDAERAALYDEINNLLGGDTASENLPILFSNYKFFVKSDIDGQRWSEAFFTSFEGDGYGNTNIWFGSMKPTKVSYDFNINRVCVSITSGGTIGEEHSDTLPNFNSLANDIYLTLDSNGRLKSDNLGDFSSLDQFNRMVLVYQDENITNNFCSAPLKYFYRKNETINGEDKLVEYIGGEININGTWYKGAWHFVEFEWGEWVTPDTWTAV